MSYSIKKILHNIRTNWGIYLFIIVAFALGLSVFLGCQSVMLKTKSDLDDAERKISKSKIQICYY